MSEHDALSVLAMYGFEVLELIPETLQRVKPTDSKKESGWYIYHSEPECLVYGDWRFGSKNIWKPENEKKQTNEEAALFAKRIKLAKIKAAEERVELQAKAEIKSIDKWKLAKSTDDHPYLETKMICGNTAKVYEGELLIPIYSPDKKLVNIQRIFKNGDKRFSYGGRIDGCFTPIKGSQRTIYVCEGYATGETIHEITNSMVFCALVANNLKAVAEWVSQNYPLNEIVICGDDDHETKQKTGDNPGRLKAEAAGESSGSVVIYPEFIDKTGKSDFNDMLLEKDGSERIEDIIFNRPAPTNLIFDTVGDLMREKLKPKDWIIKDVLLSNSLISIYGPSGSMKSFFVIDMALSIACGRSAHDCETWVGKPIKQGKVMYLAGEGLEGIRGRVEAWQDERGLTVPSENLYVSRGATMIDKGADRKRLIAMVRKCKPELLIVDTLRRNFSGNENESKEVSEFVFALDEIRKSCRCSVAVVAHTGKNVHTGEMGSVVLRNAMDTRIRLAREDEEEQENQKNQNCIVSVIITKQKDSREGNFCEFTKKVWKSSTVEDYTSLTVDFCGESFF